MRVKLPNTTRTRQRWWGVLRGVVLVGVALALLAVLVARLHTAQRLTGGNPRSPAQGHAAPDFTLHTWAWWDALANPHAQSAQVAASETRHLVALKGHPVVLNFWASWCDACRAEAPTLQAAWQRYQAEGVVFIGVDLDDTEQDSAAFLKQYGITYFNGPDATETITLNYGVFALPATVFIDRQGNIASKHSGAIDAPTLDSSIQQLLT